MSILKAHAVDEPTAILVGGAILEIPSAVFFLLRAKPVLHTLPFRLCLLQACSLARGRHVVREPPIRRITAIGRVLKSRWRSVAGHRSSKRHAREQIDVVPLT